MIKGKNEKATKNDVHNKENVATNGNPPPPENVEELPEEYLWGMQLELGRMLVGLVKQLPRVFFLWKSYLGQLQHRVHKK